MVSVAATYPVISVFPIQVSLNDTEHTITVTQSAAEGVELAVNAFM